MTKIMTLRDLVSLVKGGPYVGPRGGLWADPQHTVAWKPDYMNRERNEARIEALGREYERSKANGNKGDARYALSSLKDHGVIVHPDAEKEHAEKPKAPLTPRLFHSAPAHVIASIKKQGLRPRKGAGLFEHGGYDYHSQGKVFLADNHDAAKAWHSKVEDMLFHHHDDARKHDAVMLRVKPRATELDEVGDKDVSGSRYVTSTIPPSEIEFFHASDKKWKPISEFKRGAHGLPESDEEAHGTEETKKSERALRLQHKYIKRWKGANGEWEYEYAEPEKTEARTGALPIDHDLVRKVVDDCIAAARPIGANKDTKLCVAAGGAVLIFPKNPHQVMFKTTIKHPTLGEVAIEFVTTTRDEDFESFEGAFSMSRGWDADVDSAIRIKTPRKAMNADKAKSEMRRVLAHELTHSHDRTVTDGLRDAKSGKTGDVDEYLAYRNQKHEVTAKIQEIVRDLIDKNAVASARAYPRNEQHAHEENDTEAMARLASRNLDKPIRKWAEYYSPTYKHAVDNGTYTPENSKRILRAIADTFQAILDGKVKSIEKAHRFTIPIALMKGVKGSQAPSHKYISRKLVNGQWKYEYAEPVKTEGRTGAIEIDHARVRALVDDIFDDVVAFHELNSHGSLTMKPRSTYRRALRGEDAARIIGGDKRDFQGLAVVLTTNPPENTKESEWERESNLAGHLAPVWKTYAIKNSQTNKMEQHQTLSGHEIVINVPPSGWGLGALKQQARRVLAHEMTHFRDRGLNFEKRSERENREQTEARTGAEGYRAYRNQPTEVAASIQELHRDLIDTKAVAALRQSFEAYEKDVERAQQIEDPEEREMEIRAAHDFDLLKPMEWAEMHSKKLQRDMKHYTPENKNRIMRMVADTYEAIREGRVASIEKSERARVHAFYSDPVRNEERQAMYGKARKLHRRRVVQGMQISVENQAGSVRRWFDPHGKESGSTKMQFDYGYIRGSKGTDGDHVDVYIGPVPESWKAYVVTQMKKPDFEEVDEQKVMLGFESAKDAKAAYLAHYNDDRFFGSMKVMPVESLKKWVLAKKNHGELIRGDVKLVARTMTLDALQRLRKSGVL